MQAYIGHIKKSEIAELLDLRKSQDLWDSENTGFRNLHESYLKTLRKQHLRIRIKQSIDDGNSTRLSRDINDLTRTMLAGKLFGLPLMIVDEFHHLKNRQTQTRHNLDLLLTRRVGRILGLSATPFQLRQDELFSLLELRKTLDLPPERIEELEGAVASLQESMTTARNEGDRFRTRWMALHVEDKQDIEECWNRIKQEPLAEQAVLARQQMPPRVGHALEAAIELEQRNRQLRKHLHPFVIRHLRPRGYREHFVGHRVDLQSPQGSSHFDWAPGIEVRGNGELAHYLMMRAVSLAETEKGLPGLGAELTGSYRHLVQTSAVWKKLEVSKNTLLQDYHHLLKSMIGAPDADREHHKIQATVRRSLEFFKKGQKTLVFCVHTKTADALRKQLQLAIDEYYSQLRSQAFKDANSFENFRKRFSYNREPLFSLIQDHPLLGECGKSEPGIPERLRLREVHLHQIARILLSKKERSKTEKPNRRILLAATEYVAVNSWQETVQGRQWLEQVLGNCGELADLIAAPKWLDGREPFTRGEHKNRPKLGDDELGEIRDKDPLIYEEASDTTENSGYRRYPSEVIKRWVLRMQKESIGDVLAPYFRQGVISRASSPLPLLVKHHGKSLAEFDLLTRAAVGRVFRRVLTAPEFLLRYLAGIHRDENSESWPEYLAGRYTERLDGHQESLFERFQAYLKTLERALRNPALLHGYHLAAENLNMIQLVKGDTESRDRFFLGFNTPYRPEILISTSVGQEGIDLHQECRHVIHHDLSWNPAMIEQRTGRVDRIGSKTERELLKTLSDKKPTLEVAVPYLAATYDERMFEELYRRAQLFEVTLGGEIRIDGRISSEQVSEQKKQRELAGIGTEDEDLGSQDQFSSKVDLPGDMVERLRGGSIGLEINLESKGRT